MYKVTGPKIFTLHNNKIYLLILLYHMIKKFDNKIFNLCNTHYALIYYLITCFTHDPLIYYPITCFKIVDLIKFCKIIN